MINEDGRMIRSCGNIFKDLGFDDEESENLRIRSLLMLEAEHYIKRRKITPDEISERLNMTQTEVQDLFNGKLDAFTIDSLVNILSRLGLRMDIVVQWKNAA